MDISETITALEHHNKWRRHNSDVSDVEMLNPTYLGQVIDEAIIKLKHYDEIMQALNKPLKFDAKVTSGELLIDSQFDELKDET